MQILNENFQVMSYLKKAALLGFKQSTEPLRDLFLCTSVLIVVMLGDGLKSSGS